MKIKELNKKLKEAMLPFINLSVKSTVDSDGYYHKEDYSFTLTSADLSSILFALKQYDKELMKKFEELEKFFEN